MTLNVRSLLHKLFKLNELLKLEKIYTAFTTETRWKTDDCLQEEGFVYIMAKADNRNGGCGIVIRKELLKYIHKVVTQSSRLTSNVIKVENESYISTSSYFCTSVTSEDEINVLYDKLRDIITDSKDKNMKYIVKRDFNAKVLFNNKNERRIKKSKRKPCGPDCIFLEHLTLDGRKAAEALATSFNNHKHLIPDQMNECNIVFIKKSNSISNDISSFRPISILQTIFKIHTGTLLERMHDKIENCISASQAGFFKKNTLNQILQLCAIIQTCRGYKINLYAIFIDFKKAFDSVNHIWLLYSLAIIYFDKELVKKMEALYRSPKATFSTGINNSNTIIEIKSGI
uniref:Reverse transcriptase domain-containing protein n=1 Tax=Strongyloides venezuelensis TaxID=75913 RepID=A0A0K0FGH0_STRVS